MVTFNIICLFSMANRIKDERLLVSESSVLKIDFRVNSVKKEENSMNDFPVWR